MTETVRYRSVVGVPRMYAWHAFIRPGMFERLTPPWQDLRPIRASGAVEPGAVREFELRTGPLSLRWVAVHERLEPGRLFTDRQVRGPFKFWRHQHRFLDAGPDACELQDEIEFELPAAAVSHPLAMKFARAEMGRIFRYRHFTTFHDLTALRRIEAEPRIVALSGEPGYVVRQMGALLGIAGHTVTAEQGSGGRQFDARIRMRSTETSQVRAEIGLRSRSRWDVRDVRAATIISPDSPLVRLARALQFFELDEALGAERISWTTLDDFVFGVYRQLFGDESPAEAFVRHPTTPTVSELVGVGSGAGRELRLGRPPGPVLDRLEHELVRAQAGRQGEAAVVCTRTRFRSVEDALQTLSGQA